ncbi:peptidylprolyl isomerase [Flavobacterium sp. 7A]|uniref:peptidylprolyl isomerase n=1 Tax=Flavobacterium sp. 7A TaxID=2940571 RepID=UPI002227AD7C|nr:peptidylprolyl isomerase [Flavobacterium sp. 7A]MCW2121145.1 cyclophilin family peptidyl-prolyl cis-trans isomerase [Flavobacterium sp. 7A]
MKLKFLCLLFAGVFSLQGQITKTTTNKKTVSTTKATSKKPIITDGIFATIVTPKGNIVLSLEYKKTPVTVANFISLAKGTNPFVKDERLKGKPFFNGLKFHRVINDFMIQTGDPQGTGAGDPGYSFKDEFVPDLVFDKGGILAMANSGPKTNGSQFFITHKDTPWLNQKHTIFGHVTQGMDIVNKITQNDIITKITITKIGTEAKKFDAPKVFSDYFNNKEEDEKKQALVDEENRKIEIQKIEDQKKAYKEKYAPIIAAKKLYIAEVKKTATTTPSGLSYKVINKGTGEKPIVGSTLYFHYAGYLEDGSLFDTSYEELSKEYGQHNPNRAAQNGYQPFPYEVGKKDSMIPGFVEAIETMTYGEKIIAIIPSNLAYGESGAGGVIPPNAELIFEIEVFKDKPMIK